VQIVQADDTPKEQISTGWLGAVVKEMVCRYTVWQLKHERWMFYTHRKASQRQAVPEKLAEASR